MRIQRAVIAVLALVGACAGPGGGAPRPTDPTAAAVNDPDAITIAVVGGMSGPFAKLGEQMRQGAEQAVADINSTGGVLGRKLRLEIGDDRCDATAAVEVARNMVQRKVAFVAGHFCSIASIPASAIYASAGILEITPAASADALTDQAFDAGRKNVFRVVHRDDMQGRFIGDYLAATYRDRRIAILNDGSPYGRDIAEASRQTLSAQGIEPTMSAMIERHGADFTGVITEMKRRDIEVMVLGTYHGEAATLLRQAREQGFRAQAIAPDSLVTQEFAKLAGDTGDGTLVTFLPDPTTLPAAQPVLGEFRARGFDPINYTLRTYAAIQVFKAAAESAHSLDLDALSTALHGLTVNTVLGSLAWDDKGDLLEPPVDLHVWHIQGPPAAQPITATTIFVTRLHLRVRVHVHVR